MKRIVFTSGKMAIDLEDKLKDIEDKEWFHIVRVEEIYPFPFADITEVVKRYPNLEEMIWVQEEPKNMGAWNFVEPRLKHIAPDGVEVNYIGRRRRSSTAEGDPVVHKKSSRELLKNL